MTEKKFHEFDLAEDPWRSSPDLPPITGLAFSELRFDGDPARVANGTEVRRRVGPWRPTSPATKRRRTWPSPPSSHRSSTPSAPPGGWAPTARSSSTLSPKSPSCTGGAGTMPALAGATLVVGPKGEVHFVVRKRARPNDPEEAAIRRRYLAGGGAGYWRQTPGGWEPREDALTRVHLAAAEPALSPQAARSEASRSEKPDRRSPHPGSEENDP